MATKPQEGAQYGDISSDPGRRNKTQKFDTSVGSKDLVLAQNPTINEARAAVASSVIADRVVSSRRIGLARSNESGGQVLELQIVNGGTNYNFTSPTANTATTGGNGTGLTINYTRTSGVVTAVAVGNNSGRGYVVGDLVTSTLAGGSGVSVQITSVS
jgi:hypothetical protein